MTSNSFIHTLTVLTLSACALQGAAEEKCYYALTPRALELCHEWFRKRGYDPQEHLVLRNLTIRSPYYLKSITGKRLSAHTLTLDVPTDAWDKAEQKTFWAEFKKPSAVIPFMLMVVSEILMFSLPNEHAAKRPLTYMTFTLMGISCASLVLPLRNARSRPIPRVRLEDITALDLDELILDLSKRMPHEPCFVHTIPENPHKLRWVRKAQKVPMDSEG